MHLPFLVVSKASKSSSDMVGLGCLKIGILQLEMDKPMDHRKWFPQTGIKETVMAQKRFFTTAFTSLSVHPRPEAAGKCKVEKVGARLSSEVGESSSYHLARCVVS